jgi:hypothetical protein
MILMRISDKGANMHTNQTIYPVSVLQAGLFAVPDKPVTLSDLVKGKIPPRAQTIVLRAVGTNQGTVLIERLEVAGKPLSQFEEIGSRHKLLPEVSIEMTVADLATHSLVGETGDSVVVSYTRRMSDKGE